MNESMKVSPYQLFKSALDSGFPVAGVVIDAVEEKLGDQLWRSIGGKPRRQTEKELVAFEKKNGLNKKDRLTREGAIKLLGLESFRACENE